MTDKPDKRVITALVCTRNRGDSIVCTVQSLLASTHPRWELIVVDQSTNEETAQAILPFLTDPRLRYLRSTTRGKGYALNLGLAEAHGEIVAITDDDCEVPANWLEKMEQVFVENPGVAVVFCNVDAAPHDPAAGFIPAYHRSQSKLLSTIGDKCKARGIGAGMAVRREATLAIGGFDVMLGAGGVFPACEDGDMAVRALLKGYAVYETDSVAVLHYGFRTYAEGKQLSQRDWIGVGAAYAKPLKGGHWRFLVVPAYELFVVAVGAPLRELLRLKKPRGMMRIRAFLHGFIMGWRTPIDKETLCFRAAK